MTKSSPSRYPLIGIGVVVWREDKVLLVQRKNPPAQGQWGLPGGKQEWGETIFAAAIREVREETGVDIVPLSILTALDSLTRNASGGIDFHYTLIEVAAEWQAGEAQAADDALDARWVTMDELEQLCVWDEVVRVVRLSMLQRVL